jgi:hypothetical protein
MAVQEALTKEAALRSRDSICNGRWIVLAPAVGLLLGLAPLVTFTLGVFLKPLNAERVI